MIDPAVRRRRGLITIVVMMATIMHALDGTIANVALPSIQGSLSATQEQVSWVVTSYISGTNEYPVPALGRWNLGVGFGLMMSGFLMTTRWR